MSGLESLSEEFHQYRDHGPSANVTVLGATDTAAGPVMHRQNSAEAIAAFDAEESHPALKDPAYIQTLLKNALLLRENGEIDLAIHLLRNVLLRSPNHLDGLKQLGQCLRDCGRSYEAAKCFRAVLAQEKTPDSIFQLAEIYYLMENDAAARDLYRELLQNPGLTPDRIFEALKNIGNIQVRAGDFDGAEECYNKAYTINPNSDALMVNYGTLEIQRDNLAQALEHFRQALTLNPENDRAWVGLALIHRNMGDLELGRANIERAMDINPQNRTALKLLVEWTSTDGDWTCAIDRLKDYLAENGEDTEMSFSLAKILTHMHRLSEAEIEMERVLALDPQLEGASNLMRALQSARRVRAELK
jgi:tetratricopeptide (TPR) repeat protein